MKKIVLIAAVAVFGTLAFSQENEFTFAKFEQMIESQTGMTAFEFISSNFPDESSEEISQRVQNAYKFYYEHPTELILTQEDDNATTRKL